MSASEAEGSVTAKAAGPEEAAHLVGVAVGYEVAANSVAGAVVAAVATLCAEPVHGAKSTNAKLLEFKLHCSVS